MPKCLCGKPGKKIHGHKCVLCNECGLSGVRSAMFDAPRRASPLTVPCPSGCKTPLDLMTVTEFVQGDSDLAAYLDSVLSTIPKSRPTQFDDFNYAYDENGKLANKVTGEGFHFINQAHYDALGDLIVPHIQHLMKEQHGMQEVLIPMEAAADEGRGNIFHSADVLENTDTLLLIIQGSGAVRAGQWARALCINDSLNTGSILPYLKEAHARGWATVVMNPNQWTDDRELPDDPDFDASVFLSTEKRARSKPVERRRIRCSSNPSEHCQYVWEEIASKSPARDVLIVAHSAGGPCTLSLLRHAKESLVPRVRAIAFTDSVHFVGKHEEEHVKRVVSARAVNYVTSDEPLDTLLSESTGAECKRVSAGHTKHEHTSASAISSVFPFLDSKRTADTATAPSSATSSSDP